MRSCALSLLRRLLRRNEGQDLIEYGLLLGMVSVALVTSLGGVSTKVSEKFATTDSVLPGTTSTPGVPGTGGVPVSDDPGGNGNPGNSNPSNGNPGNSNPSNGNPGNSNPGNGNKGN